MEPTQFVPPSTIIAPRGVPSFRFALYDDETMRNPVFFALYNEVPTRDPVFSFALRAMFVSRRGFGVFLSLSTIIEHVVLLLQKPAEA